ncbi:MAG TPA: hypothetical protein VIS96_11450 [Terrimicrobiaceae bacterium]
MEKIRIPTWDDVDVSVHRLDKFRYPWLWLFIIGNNDENAIFDCLTIMCGDGAFWIALVRAKHNQLRLFDPGKVNKEVDSLAQKDSLYRAPGLRRAGYHHWVSSGFLVLLPAQSTSCILRLLPSITRFSE